MGGFWRCRPKLDFLLPPRSRQINFPPKNSGHVSSHDIPSHSLLCLTRCTDNAFVFFSPIPQNFFVVTKISLWNKKLEEVRHKQPSSSTTKHHHQPRQSITATTQRFNSSKMTFLILAETAAGYALFKAKDKKLLKKDNLAQELSTPEGAASLYVISTPTGELIWRWDDDEKEDRKRNI